MPPASEPKNPNKSRLLARIRRLVESLGRILGRALGRARFNPNRRGAARNEAQILRAFFGHIQDPSLGVRAPIVNGQRRLPTVFQIRHLDGCTERQRGMGRGVRVLIELFA